MLDVISAITVRGHWCACSCPHRIQFLCVPLYLVSALCDRVDMLSHTHMYGTHIAQTSAHTQSKGPIRHSQRSDSLITFSTLANPPAFHPSCNSPKEYGSFHNANGCRKGNIFILIIYTAQGFFWYSPTLCPFMALNDGRYLKRE